MDDSGKDIGDLNADPIASAMHSSGDDVMAIAYAHRTDANPGQFWLKWMAIAYGTWLLLATVPGARFWLREAEQIWWDIRGGRAGAPDWQTWMSVWSLVLESAGCAIGVGLIVFAKRRVAVRNLAATLITLFITDLGITLLLPAIVPSVVPAGRTASWIDYTTFFLRVSHTRLAAVLLWLACVRTDGSPWRWTFRLGWWTSLVLLLLTAASVIRFEMQRPDAPDGLSPRPSTLFHLQPQLAVQVLAAVMVLATLHPRAPLPRRAALIGGLGLLAIAGCEVYPAIRGAFALAMNGDFYILCSMATSLCFPLIPAVVLAIGWKRLPESKAATAEPVRAL